MNRLPSLLLPVLVIGTVLPSVNANADPQCYRTYFGTSITKTKTSTSSASVIPCTASSPAEQNMCFLLCGLCTTPEFAVSIDDNDATHYCQTLTTPVPSDVYAFATSILYNVSAMHGHYWLDDPGDTEANVTQSYTYLLSTMPRRDLLLLFSEPYQFLEYLNENIRYALLVRPFSLQFNISWNDFCDYVLPYSIIDEKRELFWRSRARFYQIFNSIVQGSLNMTDAMYRIANAIPLAQPLGVFSFLNTTSSIGIDPVPGSPISWKSSVSPAYISPYDVSAHGGSCTGTGIVLVAVGRSVGIPIRLAGCSQSIPNDDHHWTEYIDLSSLGPFNDYWHTKEGVSYGNAGGPWDSPSGPMLGCLSKLIPHDTINTLWAVQSSSSTYLPFLWTNDTWSQSWGFIGGVNRCGVYCTAWGCGVNNSYHWNQTECGPQ